MTNVRVEPMTAAHGPAVLAIYQAGLDTGNASFETCAPTWEAWHARHRDDQRFVAIDGDDVVGWIAVAPTSSRRAYAGVVEGSVYVAAHARGRGLGRQLLQKLIGSTESAGIWTIQTGIFPENTASLALHASVGFRVVGLREKVGQHGDRWRDVVLLERRSKVVGVAPFGS